MTYHPKDWLSRGRGDCGDPLGPLSPHQRLTNCSAGRFALMDVLYVVSSQIYEMMLVRHGYMIVGGPMGGKTCAYKVLAAALGDLHKGTTHPPLGRTGVPGGVCFGVFFCHLWIVMSEPETEAGTQTSASRKRGGSFRGVLCPSLRLEAFSQLLNSWLLQ